MGILKYIGDRLYSNDKLLTTLEDIANKVETNDGYGELTAITQLTQAEYDLITTPNPQTVYFIVG